MLTGARLTGVLGAAGIPVGDKFPEQQKYGSGLSVSVSSWFPGTSLPFLSGQQPCREGFKEPRCAGWALGDILAPRGQALSAPLSLHSVLDDEGSNLRQQKLDRQVSGAGAGWKGSQPSPSWPESGLGSAGHEGGLSPSWGGPDWWGAGPPESSSLLYPPSPARTSTWGFGQRAAGGLRLGAVCPCCGPARTALWPETCLLLLDSMSWGTRDMRPWP